MSESGQDLDLAKCPLAVGLVFKWRDLLDGHFSVLGIGVCYCVVNGRAEGKKHTNNIISIREN